MQDKWTIQAQEHARAASSDADQAEKWAEDMDHEDYNISEEAIENTEGLMVTAQARAALAMQNAIAAHALAKGKNPEAAYKKAQTAYQLVWEKYADMGGHGRWGRRTRKRAQPNQEDRSQTWKHSRSAGDGRS